MYYSEEILGEIRSHNDIVDVISQYVNLKRSGRNYLGLCPFHNEKSPSFSVSPDKQIFHCFGCGVGGDVLNFIKKIENVNFVESIQILAERAGIQLPTVAGTVDVEKEKLKEEVYKINKASAEFFHQNLYKPTSKEAQSYIKERKLGDNTLKSFLIGYAGYNNELLAYLKQKGFSEKTMLASSLIGKSSNGELYDKFRNRIMFPIQDVRNRVIAFGGRRLNDNVPKDKHNPKYINSPENIVYSKGRNLFGLNVAKRQSPGTLKRILIVEGYMDAISLYQRGITNVVASLGTALTDNQARLLRKNSEQVILGYDSDGAGQNAIIRAMSILKNMGMDIRVLQISGAKDPDEYVLKYGPERFIRCMDESLSIVEYRVKVLKQELNLENVNDKIKFLNEIAKILSEESNVIEREVYIDKISEAYQISRQAIIAEINKIIYKTEAKIQTLERKTQNNITEKKESNIEPKILKREQMIIYLLINYSDESFKRISSIVKPELIKDERNKEIITTIYEKLSNNKDIENLLDWFDNEEGICSYLTGISAYDFELTDENKLNKAIEDMENTYLRESKKERLAYITKKLQNPQELQVGEKENLQKELVNITRYLTK